MGGIQMLLVRALYRFLEAVHFVSPAYAPCFWVNSVVRVREPEAQLNYVVGVVFIVALRE